MRHPTDHEPRWKFNGGEPICAECGVYQYPDDPPRALPARKNEDGTYTVSLLGVGFGLHRALAARDVGLPLDEQFNLGDDPLSDALREAAEFFGIPLTRADMEEER